MHRNHKAMITKTFRFEPGLIEDMERVIYLTTYGCGERKYPSMTNFIVTAMSNLIQKERRVVENDGVVWDHLKPGFKQSTAKEK